MKNRAERDSRPGRQRYLVAMVLGTALTALGSTSAAHAEVPDATRRPVGDISRYCGACWRNARLPADRWPDCTQEVFSRLLERVDPEAWARVLRDEGEERREFLRAIDAVKKRTQRQRKWAGGSPDAVPDRRDGVSRRLADEVNERLYRQVNLVPLLERPFDYLGQHVASGKARGWNPTAFYPTPHPVAQCMARLLLHDADKDGRDPRLRSVCDPCVGSGRLLLHASNYSLNLWGQDIDPLAVAMCKLNGALYAPWLSFPLP